MPLFNDLESIGDWPTYKKDLDKALKGLGEEGAKPFAYYPKFPFVDKGKAVAKPLLLVGPVAKAVLGEVKTMAGNKDPIKGEAKLNPAGEIVLEGGGDKVLYKPLQAMLFTVAKDWRLWMPAEVAPTPQGGAPSTTDTPPVTPTDAPPTGDPDLAAFLDEHGKLAANLSKIRDPERRTDAEKAAKIAEEKARAGDLVTARKLLGAAKAALIASLSETAKTKAPPPTPPGKKTPPVPPPQSEKPSNKAAQVYAALLPQITAALQPIQDGGKALDALQTELRTLDDAYKAKAATSEAVALVKSLADKLPAVQEEVRRAGVRARYIALAPAIRTATTNFAGSPAWVTSAQKPLRDANNAFVKQMPKASADELEAMLKTLNDLLGPVQDVASKMQLLETFRGTNAEKIEAALALKPAGDKGLADAIAALDAAKRAIDEKLPAVAPDAAPALFADAQTCLANVRKASAARVTNLAGAKGAKKSDVRSKTAALLDEDPGILKELAATPQGRALLDDLVADLGDAAKGKADKKFMTSAMSARFGKEFKGDLTSTAMPRLYALFKMVPEGHVRDHPKLKEVKRNKNYKPSSFYTTSGDEDEGVGADSIVLNGVRTGGLKGWAVDQIAGKGSTSKYRNVKGGKAMNAFDAVTLHEIGHSVDEKEGFMSGKSGAKPFGAWLEHGVEEVADIAGAGKGFYDDFKDLPRAFLRTYLLRALGKGFDPEKLKSAGQAAAGTSAQELLGDAGVKMAEDARVEFDRGKWTKAAVKERKKAALEAIALSGSAKKGLAQAAIEEILENRREAAKVVAEQMALAPAKTVDWKALGKHEAVKWCTSVKLSGSDSGLWEKGDGASKLAIGGRVYHEAYEDDWFSYDPGALAQRVTNYQFRSPAEWFADAYSAYYLGKLPDNHPLGAWLDTQAAP